MVKSSARTATDIADGAPTMARHVAIIMDGNGAGRSGTTCRARWGTSAGSRRCRRLVRGLGPMGLECLTLYAFSSENWKRPEDEISDLMGLMRKFIKSDLPDFVANDVRLKILGDYSAMPGDIVDQLEDALAQTAKGSKTLAVGAQLRLAAGDRARGGQGGGAGRGHGRDDRRASLHRRPAAARPADPHLGRGPDLSNFLLWQAAYAEMWFTDVLWPDFHPGASRGGGCERSPCASGASGRPCGRPAPAGQGAGPAAAGSRRWMLPCGAAAGVGGWCSTRSSRWSRWWRRRVRALVWRHTPSWPLRSSRCRGAAISASPRRS
jgi:undecaprenyl diphosphate synthase